VRDADIQAPGGVSESVALMQSFLKGEAPKPLEDVIVANAAFAVYTRDSSRDFLQINEDLRSALRSGQAYRNTRLLLEIQ